MKRTPLRQSFVHAFSGMWQAWRHERNLRIHVVVTVTVCGLAGWLQISLRDWAVLVLTIALVTSAELFNTSLEAIVDLVSPERHELAKTAKDVAAAAVLVLAIAAVIVGLLILGPPLYDRLAN
ncbi:diacylglycerol kinase family protein [Symmachiella dynata]|uniref:diacylglycerol kinase family protein n=1 Tax=Symmachiella dynata TaxID=2527995 RepID=UPI0030EEF057